MKPITKNRWIILVLVVAIVITGFVLLRPKYLSPKETVELCFTHWNNKNAEGMRSLMIDRDALQLPEPSKHLEYVDLMSCYEEQNEEKNDLELIQENWYPDAQYARKVYVVFDIQFEDDAPSKGGFSNGVTGATYHLAKKTEKDPWMIVSYGN